MTFLTADIEFIKSIRGDARRKDRRVSINLGMEMAAAATSIDLNKVGRNKLTQAVTGEVRFSGPVPGFAIGDSLCMCGAGI